MIRYRCISLMVQETHQPMFHFLWGETKICLVSIPFYINTILYIYIRIICIYIYIVYISLPCGAPSVISWFIKPRKYRYKYTINYSEIGVMFTNWTLSTGGTTAVRKRPSKNAQESVGTITTATPTNIEGGPSEGLKTKSGFEVYTQQLWPEIPVVSHL